MFIAKTEEICFLQHCKKWVKPMLTWVLGISWWINMSPIKKGTLVSSSANSSSSTASFMFCSSFWKGKPKMSYLLGWNRRKRFVIRRVFPSYKIWVIWAQVLIIPYCAWYLNWMFKILNIKLQVYSYILCLQKLFLQIVSSSHFNHHFLTLTPFQYTS